MIFIYGFITTYIKLLIKKDNYIKEDKYNQLLIKYNKLLNSIKIKKLDYKKLHSDISFFCMIGTWAKGTSTPISPLATIIPSLASKIPSKLSNA